MSSLRRPLGKTPASEKNGVVPGDTATVDKGGGSGGGDALRGGASAATDGNATQRPTEPSAPSDTSVEALREEKEKNSTAASTATALAATIAAPPEAEHETAAAAEVAAAGGEEAGLDMSDFEDLLLDHLKTSDYPAGEYIFRFVPSQSCVFVLYDCKAFSRAATGGM